MQRIKLFQRISCILHLFHFILNNHLLLVLINERLKYGHSYLISYIISDSCSIRKKKEQEKRQRFFLSAKTNKKNCNDLENK